MKLIGESFAGVGTAATRMVELFTPKEKRLFDDPYSMTLLPGGWRAAFRFFFMPGLRGMVLAARERRMPGSLGSILCRARYMDDVVKDALEKGVEQVVILGAGFDSRAYRIEGIEKVRVFEVDFPGTGELKQRRLEKVLGAVPGHVTLVGIDFDRQDLGETLTAAGFQGGKRNLFISEGLTQYITQAAFSQTLDYVSSISAAGSGIVFTYVLLGLVEDTAGPAWFKNIAATTAKLGSPMITGYEQNVMPQFLTEHGFTLIEDVSADEYQQRYLQPLGRELDVFDGERAVLAEVKK